jgi:hypothetical protein
LAGKGKTAAKGSRPQGGHDTLYADDNLSHKQTLTPSTVTLKAQLNVHNTHGMNTSSHNAFWKKGVSERSV